MWYKNNYTFIALLLLSSLATLYLWLPVDESVCNAAAMFKSKSQKYEVHATKVVVQPWLGHHHVYGIFIVSDEYKETPYFVLTVKGAGSYCKNPFGTLQYIDGIFAEPGTHLIRDYIKTRTALQLIFHGLYNQIKEPQNWTLTFPRNISLEKT
jgi:hypothetical protein